MWKQGILLSQFRETIWSTPSVHAGPPRPSHTSLTRPPSLTTAPVALFSPSPIQCPGGPLNAQIRAGHPPAKILQWLPSTRRNDPCSLVENHVWPDASLPTALPPPSPGALAMRASLAPRPTRLSDTRAPSLCRPMAALSLTPSVSLQGGFFSYLV